ncbi:hypothetical protein MNBD_GAMMA25-1068 [hydrothermal vent metagenome]|uniref:Glyoxalase/fosfomycin resistance/dioxygenase domain-containing protein n=1 Tax=hydrothermal vent metagenome TaxID=652676 RepID=A0A3B1AIA7_9ZZZZ
MPINIQSLDHLVLIVANIERSGKFYTSVLGMELIIFTGLPWEPISHITLSPPYAFPRRAWNEVKR